MDATACGVPEQLGNGERLGSLVNTQEVGCSLFHASIVPLAAVGLVPAWYPLMPPWRTKTLV
jgi:hypothetical protein